MNCANPDCLYLHSMAKAQDTFSKEQIQQGLANRGGQHDVENTFAGRAGTWSPILSPVKKPIGAGSGSQGFPKRGLRSPTIGGSAALGTPASEGQQKQQNVNGKVRRSERVRYVRYICAP